MQNKMSLIGNPPNKSVRRFIGRTLPDLTGFPRDRTDSTISVAGNVFTIAPVGASFTYWYQGREVTKAAAETVTISDVEGLHYIYYDEDAVLQETAVFDIDFIYIQALVSIVYWDADNNAALLVADERHGRVMSAETHAHLHLVLGTQWVTGLALDGFTIGDGSLETHAQFGYTAGQIRDEDIESDNVADTAPAQISVFYKSGATGVWRRRTANNFPMIYSGDGSGYVGANGRVPFNEFSGGNWVLTEVSTNNDFILMHYFATTDPDQPVIAVQGEVEYTNINAAREGAATEINAIVTAGLPGAEFTPIGSVIYQTNGGYANTPNCRVRTTDEGDNYVDFRGFKFSSTGSPGSHAQLGDLAFSPSGHVGFQPIVFEDAGDPDANDDIANSGGNGVFLTGYFWLNTTSGEYFICTDDTATAAVWQLLGPTTADGQTNVSTPLQSGANGDLRLARLGIGVAPIAADNTIALPDAGYIGNGAATARMGFNSSGATDFSYIMSSNVGINTNTPEALLEVKAGIFRVTGTNDASFVYPTADVGFEIRFGTDADPVNNSNTGGPGASIFQSFDRDGTVWENLWFRSYDTVFTANTENFVIFYNDNTARFIFDSSNVDYGLGARGTLGGIYIMNNISAKRTQLELYTSDGDGTDDVGFQAWGVGDPDDLTNSERGAFGWDEGDSEYQLYTAATGTGTLRPIVIFTSGNADQVHLDTSGQVGFSVAAPASRIDIGAGAMTFAEMTAPGAPAANGAILYAVDNGAGKTQLAVRFNTGAVQILATEP